MPRATASERHGEALFDIPASLMPAARGLEPTRLRSAAATSRSASPRTKHVSGQRTSTPPVRRNTPSATAGRRTVTISGRGDDRYVPPSSRSSKRAARVHDRAGTRPDRIAMWAVMLGLMLVLVAATSSHAAGRLRLDRAHDPGGAIHIMVRPAQR